MDINHTCIVYWMDKARILLAGEEKSIYFCLFVSEQSKYVILFVCMLVCMYVCLSICSVITREQLQRSPPDFQASSKVPREYI